ncbi:MAG: 6-phosphogluconolactonase [Haliea sp.]|nr:6-phosphogluconolactonase [Haliea sp.]|tara:strand:- start:3640 stop:4320 length:681 start_codon:yes stop_codon:yes gene_type:complete
MRKHDFSHRVELDQALARTVAAALRVDLAQQPRVSLALSGGSTPRGMLQQLSRHDLDWQRVDITLVDERWVAPDSPEANEHLLRECLLQGPAAAAQLYPLLRPQHSPESALPALEAMLAGLPRPFTAVVLGMGADGHTASWFPGADNLASLLDAESQQRVAATRPASVPQARVTLTLAAVLDSRNIHLHLTGTDKRTVLDDATELKLPVAQVLQQTHTPLHIWWSP